MKKIMAIAAAMLLTVSGFAQSGQSIYNKYSEHRGVSAVYISPAMFRMMGRIPEINLSEEGMDLTPIIRSLNGLYIISSENAEINGGIKDDVLKFAKDGRYELMMEAKDDGEIVRIYTKGNESTVTSFVLLASEEGECTFISLDGNMARSDLEKLLQQAVESEL